MHSKFYENIGVEMFDQNSLINDYLSYHPQNIAPNLRGSIHFDYLFSYTQQFHSPSEMVGTESATEMTALWITSYLAHWGMYRGSSRLGDLNIIYFKELLPKLLSKKSGKLTPIFDVDFKDLHKIDKKSLSKIITEAKEALYPVSPTSTLVSKLILGLTHNMPGFDRYFIAGLNKLQNEQNYVGPASFGASSLIELSKWYDKRTWPEIPCAADTSKNLPSARLIDMAIFQYGF